MYNEKCLQDILQPFQDTLGSYESRVPVFSSYTGELFQATNSLDLVEAALEEILRKPLHWDRVIEGTCSEMERSGVSECTIFPAGPAEVGRGLVSALQRNKRSCVAALDDGLWNFTPDANASNQSSGKFADSKIAIVGMSGRFPNAANHELFWELLEKGTDTHKIIPKDRFDESHIDPSGQRKNTSHTPFGCFIDEPGLFDARFFRMSPREATQTDPMHRLALLTAYEALEMSGYVPNRTSSTRLHRIGTFYGQTSDDWREIQEGQNIDTYFIPGGVRAFAPGRINYYFKFSGPSYSVDTACSSSFAALQLAITSLRSGDCDTAVTGGMNVLSNPDIFSGLSRGQFLSKTGNCQTFDNEADGYCRGEGVASVILKRLEDAEADKDNILGVMLASGTNHSADAISITHPHAPTQQYLYKQLLNKSNIDPNEICYVEMHGTGTQAGDGTEMESVTNVFADPHRKRRPDQPLHLGAVKANIGHGEAASGICALIKVLLMMEKNAISPNCGIKGVINQGFPKDLIARNVHIPVKATPWPRPNGQRRRVYISNFSAAGGNTGVIMEDAPLVLEPQFHDPRSTQIVAVSGRSKSSLRNNLQRLIDFIGDNPAMALTSLSYTTTARRIHHNYRVAVAESDLSTIRKSLASSLDKDIAPIAPSIPDIAFVFTGQGSHYAALGKQLFEHSTQFQTDIHKFDTIAQSQGLPSLLPLVDGTLSDISDLSPVVVQLGQICVQMALTRLWMSWGVMPAVVIGHSLGEYAALNAAGVLSIADTIALVGRRAQELVTKCTPGTHAMLAVASSISSIEPYITDRGIEIACINSSSETVLGGPDEQIDKVAKDLSRNGVKATKLRIPFAFHISQVDPVLDSYEKIAKGVTFNPPSIPVLSPLLGDVIRNGGSFNSTYVKRHARETVNFPRGMEAGIRDGTLTEKTVWVEVGPHPVCLAMVKKIMGAKITAVPSLRRKEDDWKAINGSLVSLYGSGLDIDWNEYQRDFNPLQRLLRLPTYSFDLKNHWIDYTGNWTLTKGEVGAIQEAPEPTPKLSTTSVQKIVEESIHDSEASVTIESDISEPRLKAAIQGHMVNDTALCPSSLYADMALTIADYLHRQLRPNAEMPALSCGAMEVDKPLIASQGGEQQLLRVDGSAHLKSGNVRLRFYSVTSEGKTKVEHAKCTVSYVDPEAMLTTWSRYRYLIKPRVEALENGVNNGMAEKVHRNMAYSLFGSFVKYSAAYRGMEEVALNSEEYEATAKLAFQTTADHGDFLCSPYWIDSVGHLSGFVLNVKEALGNRTNVFVSHGWESMCFARPLSKDKTYQSYVKMQPAGGKMMAGDVLLFDEDEIIGVIDGLKFQCIPRTLLNAFLPPAGGAAQKSTAKIGFKGDAQNTNKVKPKEAPAPVSAPPVKKTQTGLSSRALNAAAEEIGVPTSELSDNVVFEEMGVDSLMSLTISSRLREELDMDLSSTLFTDHPTVAEFSKYFAANESADATAVETAGESMGSSTPTSDQSGDFSVEDTASTTPSSSAGDEVITEAIRTTIADEMGVPVEEILGETNLASIGMDSLMSLTILANLRETTGQELSSDFFVENPSMTAIENTLYPKSKPILPTPAIVEKSAQEVTSIVEKSAEKITSKANATSLLLQGNPKTASQNLFLFPDGSGSASSYASISPISPSTTAVYGLNCPFMKNPGQFTCGIPGVSALYKAEVQRRQPLGPYHLGGWSAGGVVAYEVAQQLIQEGETVSHLILLDSPCPIRLEPLPARLHRFLDQIGLLGTGAGEAPEWLLPHFDSAIKALDEYKPARMDATKAPKTFAIWATDGVCGNPEDVQLPRKEGDPKSMRWLLENRTDFGSNGWDELLGGDGKMRFATVEGNHFTIMRQPKVSLIPVALC